MMHGYFKMGSLSCRIVSDTSLFIYKTRIPAVSMTCFCRIHAVPVHHSLEPMKVRITRDSNIGVWLNPKIIPNGILVSIVFEESSHLQKELITSVCRQQGFMHPNSLDDVMWYVFPTFESNYWTKWSSKGESVNRISAVGEVETSSSKRWENYVCDCLSMHVEDWKQPTQVFASTRTMKRQTDKDVYGFKIELTESTWNR